MKLSQKRIFFLIGAVLIIGLIYGFVFKKKQTRSLLSRLPIIGESFMEVPSLADMQEAVQKKIQSQNTSNLPMAPALETRNPNSLPGSVNPSFQGVQDTLKAIEQINRINQTNAYYQRTEQAAPPSN